MNGSKYDTSNTSRKSYGSLDETIILIESNESTPLLVDRRWSMGQYKNANNNNNKNIINSSFKDKDVLLLSDNSLWSFESKLSNSSSIGSTKSFRSHFWELKVLAFALLFLAGIAIAAYLLIVETRLPSITFSLDLVHHDVWSIEKLPMGQHIEGHNFNSVIITQTGSKNCDNPLQCQYLLQQLQYNYSKKTHQELPYNFLIGCNGVAYEVRGWNYESNMEGVDPKHSLVIGFIGNFDRNFPPSGLIKTFKFLIKESIKRQKLKKFHSIYNHKQFCTFCNEEQIMK
ncbi:peptidoglycan-recognition protein LD-like [Haematobia irritans]|uniref:peptidoglycan-recognition protein LD-like n=1 Tax=Haematobia irritans TaxID=7368 RepID=UPI003F50191B